jgi:4-hydroxymandelate oxidase
VIKVADVGAAARERLDPAAYGYIAGGAGDEHTLRENRAAFERWELRPRVLVDVGTISTRTTVLGTEVALPILVAPRRSSGLPIAKASSLPPAPPWRRGRS